MVATCINDDLMRFTLQWENHSRSLKLEAVTLEKIKNRITEKVMGGSGTWIDWQYLFDSAKLLARCRYTLQYTYPYAYYMDLQPRKQLVRAMRAMQVINLFKYLTFSYFFFP